MKEFPHQFDIDYGYAERPCPGHSVSGDRQLLLLFSTGFILIVIDGLGHGKTASEVAQMCVDNLRESKHESVDYLMRKCHQILKGTRGVVLSLASYESQKEMIHWLGVGNVEGHLFRANPRDGVRNETLLLRGGIVGYRLPTLRPRSVQVEKNDTLIFVTDGIKSAYCQELKGSLSREIWRSPKKTADHVLAKHFRGRDDATVSILRFIGGVYEEG